MKVLCPACSQAVAASDINVQTGLAVCRACNEAFNVAGMVAGAVATPADGGLPPLAVPAEKPAGTRIERVPYGDGFGLLLPRGGARGLGVFLVIFGGFWDLISGGILLSTVLTSKFSAGAAFDLLFVGGFFVVGLAILLGGLALLTMRTALVARDRTLRVVRSVPGKEFVTAIALADLVRIDRVVRYSENDVPVYGLGLFLADGKCQKVGVRLSPEECAWMRWLIMEYRGPDPH